MIDFVVQYLDWILAVLGLYGQYITFVRKSWWSVWYGLAMQAGWVTYAIVRSDYGLIFLCFGSTTIFITAISNDRKLALRRMIEENAEKNQAIKETLHLNLLVGETENGND